MQAVGAEEGAEEAALFGAVGVDLRRQEVALLGGERRQALLARRLHDLARHVQAEHPQAVAVGEVEDRPVVLPVIAPVVVPARLGEELGRGEPRIGRPLVEHRLLAGRIHLEADQDLAPAALELLDHPQLHLVELVVGVALADEEELHAVEARGELGGGDDVAPGGVGDAVEHHRRLAVAPRRIAQRQIEDLVAGRQAGGRHQQGQAG